MQDRVYQCKSLPPSTLRQLSRLIQFRLHLWPDESTTSSTHVCGHDPAARHSRLNEEFVPCRQRSRLLALLTEHSQVSDRQPSPSTSFNFHPGSLPKSLGYCSSPQYPGVEYHQQRTLSHGSRRGCASCSLVDILLSNPVATEEATLATSLCRAPSDPCVGITHEAQIKLCCFAA